MTSRKARQQRMENMETTSGSNEVGGEQQATPDSTVPRKSWSELRTVVSDLRRKLSGVSAGSVPGSITFRSLPDGR